MSVSYLKIEEVKTAGMQVRASMSEDTIAEYMEAMAGGAVFPPVLCFHDGTAYWLADGFHRLEAWRRTGCKKCKAEVKTGERLDALRYALRANLDHGLRRTNADKKRAVMVAYENRQELGLGNVPSARSIAELIGVGHPFVTHQLESDSTWRDAKERTGTDGKTYSVPPPRPLKPSKQVATVASCEGGKQGDEQPELGMPDIPPARPLPPPQRPQASGERPQASTPPERTKGPELKLGPRDSLGNPIPSSLTDHWGRRVEVQAVSASLRQARLAIRKAQDGHDPAWAGLNFSSTLMHLDNAIAQVEGAVPHCVCLYCKGIGCRACGGSGIMTEFQHSNVPRDIKGA